jgi:soluble lytic murein transglycosylase-like protein
MKVVMIRHCRFALLGLSLATSSAVVHADVLEIDAAGASWIAGGPVATVRGYGNASEALQISQPSLTAGPVQWRNQIARLAAKYDLSPQLLEALVWQESRWRPGAVSPAGARGLTQLMPGTARDLGVDPDDPIANLEGGARYLRQQLNTFGGNLEKALAAYNAGPKRVMQAGGIPNIPETRGYVAAIMARLAQPARR